MTLVGRKGCALLHVVAPLNAGSRPSSVMMRLNLSGRGTSSERFAHVRFACGASNREHEVIAQFAAGTPHTYEPEVPCEGSDHI
jgi:hypothetical protein